MVDPRIVASVCIVCLAAFATCQQPAPDKQAPSTVIAQAMQQSRSGAWRKGVATTNALLQRTDLSVTDRAAALSLLAACHARLGEKKRADAAVAAFDEIADEVPSGHWSRRSIAKLRGDTPKARKADGGKVLASADLPTRIWSVRQSNQVGQHAAAAEAAERILAEGVGSVEQRCDLWLHLAFARSRTQKDTAEQAFARFATEAKRLPASHHLILEMQLLRQSLGMQALPGLAADAKPFAPPASDDYWQPIDDASRLPAEVLATLRTLCTESGTDGLLVTRRGKIAFEFYSPLYREPMRTMSSCKSITGLLAGMLIERGKLDLDDKVGTFVEGWQGGLRGDVTVRHLLTMTAGLPRRSAVPHVPEESWNDYAARQIVANAPGSRWEYTNEGVQLLSPILEQAAGMPLQQFADEELFAKIGAKATRMRRLRGATNTYADAATTLREFARLGELVRRGGTWPEAGQVVPAAWLEAMTRPCPQAANYGYLWWIEPEGRGVSMRGYLDTNVWVFPSLEIVVARVQQRAYLHATRPFDSERMYRALSRD